MNDQPGKTAQVVRLPSGFEFPVPEGMTPEQALSGHCGLSVAGGICPYHSVPLEPVGSIDGRIAGHCPKCHWYWSYEPERQQWGWDLDHDPFTSAPVIPAWFAERPAPRLAQQGGVSRPVQRLDLTAAAAFAARLRNALADA